MSSKKFIYSLSLLILTFALNAQESEIIFKTSGTLKFNEDTGETDVNAFISVVQDSIITKVQTDSLGRFQLRSIANKNEIIRIRFEAEGFIGEEILLNITDWIPTEPHDSVFQYLAVIHKKMTPSKYANSSEYKTVSKYWWNDYLKSDKGFSKAQKLILKLYENEIDSLYESYYESGNIKEHISINKGLPSGKYSYYFENGDVKTEMYFNNGQLNGEYIEYYEEGSIRSKCYYLNDILLSRELYIYDKEGTLEYTVVEEIPKF